MLPHLTSISGKNAENPNRMILWDASRFGKNRTPRAQSFCAPTEIPHQLSSLIPSQYQGASDQVDIADRSEIKIKHNKFILCAYSESFFLDLRNESKYQSLFPPWYWPCCFDVLSGNPITNQLHLELRINSFATQFCCENQVKAQIIGKNDAFFEKAIKYSEELKYLAPRLIFLDGFGASQLPHWSGDGFSRNPIKLFGKILAGAKRKGEFELTNQSNLYVWSWLAPANDNWLIIPPCFFPCSHETLWRTGHRVASARCQEIQPPT